MTRPRRWMACAGNWPFAAHHRGNFRQQERLRTGEWGGCEAVGAARRCVERLAEDAAEANRRAAGTAKDASIGLSGGSYAVPPVKGVTSFSRINGQASALLEMVEATSDQAPVPSLYRTYSDLCRDFNATLAVWQSLQAKVEVDAGIKHADHGSGINSCEPVSPKSSD